MSSMGSAQTDRARLCIDLVNLLLSTAELENLELPSIVVIGDKNSGKTSVLERLSGVKLPRGNNYTVILQMKQTKGGEMNGLVKCVESSLEKRISPLNSKNVPDLMRECLSGSSTWYFNSKKFILEISSPDVPNLTLIDLPSIPSKQDKSHDAKKTYIRNIITNPECIILMVVPCNVDITSTESYEMVQEVDPDGQRTWGLLTKPDIVDQVTEKSIADIVQNKVINLKKGFMIVRCYDQTKRSLMDPNEKELKFFKEHALFKSLYDGGYATVPKLAERLSQEMAEHIEKYLPQLKEYVNTELLQTNAAIKRFGKPPPSDEASKLPFLTDKLNTFIQDTMKFTSGELLDLTDQRVFSVWRKFVQNSEESFRCNLEAKVALHEQSGFSDIQMFEQMIEEQITLLEGPAIFTLTNAADIIKNELLAQMESAFFGFLNLISKSKPAISDVILSNQKAAESWLRTLFKMELFEVHVEGRKDSTKKREKKRGITAHYHSCYQTICQRLTSQIQMGIRYYMIKESSAELQKKMLRMLDDKKISDLLEYDWNLMNLRDTTQKCFMPLTQAQMLLSEIENAPKKEIVE